MPKKSGTIYHSGHLLVLAKRAYERSHQNETDAEVSLILSAIALEGSLNEIPHMVLMFPQAASLMAMRQMLNLAEESNAQPKLKLQILHYALTGQAFDNGSIIAQDFDALMALRNALVHVKPMSVYWAMETDLDAKPLTEYPKPVRHLAKRKVITLPELQPHTWRQLVGTPPVARWGHNVAVRTMQHIAKWAPKGDFSEMMQSHTEGIEILRDEKKTAT